jgi:hypothetical protein
VTRALESGAASSASTSVGMAAAHQHEAHGSDPSFAHAPHGRWRSAPSRRAGG